MANIFDEISDGDFVALQPKAIVKRPELLLSCIRMGRAASERLQITLTAALLDEIGAARVEIGYAPAKRLLRVKSSVQGPFEPARAPKGDGRFLRMPLPAGMHFQERSEEPEYWVDRIGKVILIECPQWLLLPPMKALPAPAPGPAAPPRTPVPDDDDQAAIRAYLELDTPAPRQLAGVKFTPAEMSILLLLSKRETVSRSAILVATQDAANEDDRDPKIVDVFISKMRKRLQTLGLEVINPSWGTGHFKVPAEKRYRLRELIKAAQDEAC